MSLAILFHFLCVQHVLDINISNMFFWVFPRRQIVVGRRFGTLYRFHLQRLVVDCNISIIKSLQLCCWITTSVVLFLFRCVFEIWRGWFWVVSVLRAEASTCSTGTTQTKPHQISNTQRTENKTTDVVIQQHSCKLLVMDILTFWRLTTHIWVVPHR